MNLNKAAQTAVLSLCLLPQMSWAQEAASEAPASQEAASPEPQAAEPKETLKDKAMEVQEKSRGLLGDFRVGPHVALGFPHPLTFGIDLVYADLFGLSYDVGNSKYDVDADTELRIQNWDLSGRWFVFGGSFFLGAAYGHQKIVAKVVSNVDVTSAGSTVSVPAHLQLDVDADYLTPQLGWFARWDWGLTLGFELGLQMPSGAKSKLKTEFSGVPPAVEAEARATKEFTDSKDDIEKVGKDFGKTSLPYISLLKIGYLF